MTDDAEYNKDDTGLNAHPPSEVPPMLRFWKWKWIWRSVFTLMILVPCGLLAGRAMYRSTGATQLYEHTDKLDRDDPDWRLPRIEAKYNAGLPPDDENPMTACLDVIKKFGAAYKKSSGMFPQPDRQPLNALLPAKDAQALRKMLSPEAAAFQDAKAIGKLTKEGGTPIRFAPIPIATLLPDVQSSREVSAFLRYQLWLAIENDRPDEATAIVLAMAKVPRAFGKHPTLIGLLVRIATAAIAGNGVEHMLACGTPTNDLAELQAALTYEAERLNWADALRGERAAFHRMIEGLDRGEFDRSAFTGVTAGGLQAAGETWLLRTNIHRDWLLGLQMFEKHLAAADQPYVEQKRVMDECEAAIKKDRWKHMLTGLLLPAVEKVGAASHRGTGQLRAVAVGIACERYRQKFGKWPETLADIPKDILPEIPHDPFTGRPIQYKHLPDGVTVYSIGPDGIDHGGLTRDINDYQTSQRDWGIKLYHPELRRKPAPAVEPDDVTLDPEPGLPDPDEPKP